MRLQKPVVLIIALFAIIQVFAQNTDYPSKWKEIESLSEKGLYDQALKQSKSLFAAAQKEENSVQMVKALIHQFNYSQQFEEDAVVKSIQELETVKEQVSGLERALLDAALSDLYLFYYQNNHWEINQRQEISGTRPSDMAFWTKEHFKSEIENLLQESLSYEKILKSTSSEYWQEIFVKDTLGFEVFPTLYDFVAWKAIEFYSSYDLINSAKEDLLVLNDPLLFGDYQEFLSIDLSEYDSSFYKVKTLKFYQKLLKMQEGRKTQMPFLSVESNRLKYINANGQIDAKQERIISSLNTTYNKFKSAAGVEFIAQQLLNNLKDGDEIQRKQAVVICQEMMKQNKATDYFKVELTKLQMKGLSINMETEILPNNPSFAQVNFRNLSDVWFKIAQLDKDFDLGKFQSNNTDFNVLLKQNIVSEFKLKLSEKERLIGRTALIDLPPLDYGQYVIIASSSPDFNQKNDKLTGTVFHATRIQLISNGYDGQFLVVDRETGSPIGKAKVEVFSQQWEYSTRSQIKKLVSTLYTNENGFFDYSTSKSESVSIKISKAQDEWESNSNRVSPKQEYKSSTSEKHYFFTDRSIYRPGQNVYFKGIFVERNGFERDVLANHPAEIKFYGANGKLIKTLNLISNEYGSVSESFTIPLSSAKGNYRISTKEGNAYFKVEEYKRPKFEVSIENPTEEYQLNELIKIKGKAAFFAGSALQNAKVKYRVSRSVYNPWRYGIWPNISELDITAGETSTDKAGNFELSFIAIAPDFEGLNPWYNYQITAEVTDETGETHEDVLNIRLGKTTMNISSNLPKMMDLENPKDVIVKAETPNGQKLYPEMTFKLEKLKPQKELKKQIDFSFDTLLLSVEKQEKEYQDYRFVKPQSLVEAIVLEKKLHTQIDSIISKSIFKSLTIGIYKMTLSSYDKNGNPIVDSAEFQVFSTRKNKLSEAQEFFSYVNRTHFEVGDTLQISFGTSFNKPEYYFQLVNGHQIVESKWLKVNKELNHINMLVKEEYRGGFSVQVFMVKENQFYEVGGKLDVPYSNKKLDVQLSTFRNPMQPGVKEKWTLKIKNNDNEVRPSEVLAAMYDASLDEFTNHKWHFWPYSSKGNHYYWRINNNYSVQLDKRLQYRSYAPFFQPSPLELNWMFFENRMMREVYGMYDKSKNRSVSMAATIGGGDSTPKMEAEMADEVVVDKEISEIPTEDLKEQTIITPRKNLQETAFFYPQLTTNKDGNVELNFTSPEALTRWKLMVLAHTKDMKIGQLTQEVNTQKQLMVMPNLPRFLRGGDEITISAKVINLLEEDQQVKARLEILNASTREVLNLFVVGQDMEQSLRLSASGQVEVNWQIQVPEKVGAVIIRITAQGDQHSDGEEHILPVLSQLHFLTETYPFTLSKDNTISSQDLQLRAKERTADDELTLEIVSNPLWYVVQAIPNYQTPQKADALQWMNYFYVQSMAAHIVKVNPEIEEVFKQWRMVSPEELESELFQNPELKKVMIEETPWLLNAENQSQRKQEIARLFDENNLNMQLETALNKLAQMQKPNGGFGWIDGMKTSPWISAQIASFLGQLLEADILDLDDDYKSRNIIKNLVKYIDDELEIAYQKAQKDPKKYHSSQSNLLTARSYFLEIQPLKKSDQAFEFFLNKWKDKKYQKSLSEKMRLARVLWNSDKKEEAKELLAAIQDIALTDEHGGVYWRDFQRYESVSQQAEMIALFELTDQESNWREGMELWLLQQKRANDWGNRTSTARACLVMLADAPQLAESPKVYLTQNGEETIIDGNAGTGYFKITWKGQEIDAALENLQIRKEGKGMIFGAFYDQYFEKMSEIENHDGGVSIQKQIFVAKTINDEQRLLPIDEGNQINLGDRILIRITLENKQAMDFVHLRDYLPAGFENKNPLSGYHWQGAVSYYTSPGDIATDYYLQHLPKGKFLIEYELNATISGTLNSGPAEIQSLYAPEFGGHSDGDLIKVKRMQ